MSRLLPMLATSLALVANGCVTISSQPDAGPRPDTGPITRPDAGPPPDAGSGPECTPEGEGATLGEPCDRDRECDDGCFCNGLELCTAGICQMGPEACAAPSCIAATCDEDSDRCTRVPDDTQCDDGIFCNGAEVCDGEFGCRPGPPPFCNDSDICTIDFCDESASSCGHEIVDVDNDGHPSTICGGLDCNDDDPTRSPDEPEICDNGFDDDCDGARDIADSDCASSNDECDDGDGRGPADITPSGLGTFEHSYSTVGLDDHYDVTCATGNRLNGPDAVFTFTLDTARDITLEVRGLGNDAVIALRPRAACADLADLRCGAPTSSLAVPTVNRPNLPAGEYAVVVITENPTIYTLVLTVEESDGVQDEFCSDDTLDVSGGGTFTGTFQDHLDDYDLPCRSTSANYRDIAARLTVPAGEVRDVTLRATASLGASGRQAYVALVSECGVSDPDVSECLQSPADGVPAELLVRGLAEGTYFVLLEGERTQDTDWILEVSSAPSTGRPAGDECADDLPIDITTATGSVDLADLSPGPDEGAYCGANRPGHRDAYFYFDLTETLDVEVTTHAGAARHWVGVSSECGVVPAVTDCYLAPNGSGTDRFVRLPAGRHFVNVSTLAASGTLMASIATFPPTPTPPNDDCAGASPIADGSALDVPLPEYTNTEDGLCGAAGDADAFYTFTLATSRFVSIRADGAESASLLDGCTVLPIACGAGAPPRIEGVYAAGTYTIAVESAPGAAQTVRLRFSTTDP